MSSQSASLTDELPRSHYFVTVSHGTRMRTVAIRAFVLRLTIAVLPLLGLIGIGSTLYLVFHDDLVAELMRRQSAIQYAYEDRIAGLQQDIEHQAERGRADQAQMEARLHDLFAREAKLESHGAVVAELAADAGLAVPKPQLPPEITGRISAPGQGTAPDALGYAPADKPRPLPETTGSLSLDRRFAAHREDGAALLDEARVPLGLRLVALDGSLDGVAREQAKALMRIGATARQRVAGLRALIEEVGLTPERYLAKTAPSTGLGGPFVPLPEGDERAFGRELIDLRGTVAAAAQLGAAVGRLPLAAPLAGHQEVTSPFGARLDPFLGRPALHTGVDLREGYGSDIKATASGRVVFAGAAGGYGNMVEIDHGNGISTRYAHMGGILVSDGQSVARGTVVGIVGATGRATGPHLHYEVRVDGEPVDPMRFLNGSQRLAGAETP